MAILVETLLLLRFAVVALYSIHFEKKISILRVMILLWVRNLEFITVMIVMEHQIVQVFLM